MFISRTSHRAGFISFYIFLIRSFVLSCGFLTPDWTLTDTFSRLGVCLSCEITPTSIFFSTDENRTKQYVSGGSGCRDSLLVKEKERWREADLTGARSPVTRALSTELSLKTQRSQNNSCRQLQEMGRFCRRACQQRVVQVCWRLSDRNLNPPVTYRRKNLKTRWKILSVQFHVGSFKMTFALLRLFFFFD